MLASFSRKFVSARPFKGKPMALMCLTWASSYIYLIENITKHFSVRALRTRREIGEKCKRCPTPFSPLHNP